jgi:hypothetical protein
MISASIHVSNVPPSDTVSGFFSQVNPLRFVLLFFGQQQTPTSGLGLSMCLPTIDVDYTIGLQVLNFGCFLVQLRLTKFVDFEGETAIVILAVFEKLGLSFYKSQSNWSIQKHDER